MSSLPLLVSSVLGGCYAHHTADEELLDIPFPADTYPDGGANVIADAGGNKCTQSDPIQLLLCQFTSGGGLGGAGGTGTGTTGGTTDLSGLSGLINQFFGGGTGTPTGAGSTGLTDLINQLTGMRGTTPATGANGLGGIQDLINMFTGMQGTATNTGTQPSLQDVIAQILGGGAAPDAGAPVTGPNLGATSGVSEAQCANPASFQVYIQCALAGFATPTGVRRDGGAAQPGDAGMRRDGGTPFLF